MGALAAVAAAVVVAVAAIVVPIAASGGSEAAGPSQALSPGGDVPDLAVQVWPALTGTVGEQCPEMDVAWLGALVEVESSWDPQASHPETHASGLTQAMHATWVDAASGERAVGGWPDADGPPAEEWPGWDAQTHLEVMVPWICSNLRHAAEVIEARGLDLDPHTGAAVCHIAGCSRLQESASGIPQPGEAGCGADCSATVQDYVARIESARSDYTAIVPAGPSSGDAPAPAPPGGLGCVVDDPTSTRGCVTPRAAHLVGQLREVYGTERPINCWAHRPANPRSDHPAGRACDVTIGEIGEWPSEAERQAGWRLVRWVVEHADRLAIRYVIWDGQIWYPHSGWETYTSGVYDVTTPTGGHYDHPHISVEA